MQGRARHPVRTAGPPPRAPSDAPYRLLIAKAIVLMALIGLLAESTRGLGAETSISESQVKSIFLLNFAKYVDWPSNAFATANAPIMIGVLGGSAEDKFARELARTVE